MKKSLGGKKADFIYDAWGIFKTYLFCRMVQPRATLKKFERTRNDLYYSKGLERLNSEADIANLIGQLRTMRYFLKTVLNKD
jgi:hypothetical protein